MSFLITGIFFPKTAAAAILFDGTCKVANDETTTDPVVFVIGNVTFCFFTSVVSAVTGAANFVVAVELTAVGGDFCDGGVAAIGLDDVDADLCCNIGGADFVLAVADIALAGNFDFAVDVVAVDFGAFEGVVYCDGSVGIVTIAFEFDGKWES